MTSWSLFLISGVRHTQAANGWLVGWLVDLSEGKKKKGANIRDRVLYASVVGEDRHATTHFLFLGWLSKVMSLIPCLDTATVDDNVE